LLAQGVNPSRIEVIPNFSSLAPHERDWSRQLGPPRFVSVGRMVKKKGFDVLLRAFRQFLDQGQLAELVLGGEGPERGALERLAQDLGLGARVHFPGWIADVGALLRSAGAFVLPSLDEPFGVAVLEAMASNLPIIATSTKGPLEILDESTAYLVPIGDAAALAARMTELVADSEEGRRRADAALERYRTHYRDEIVIPQYESAYRRLLSDHRPASVS
jgi:glycosyltransferase involved in cell wall biosynthesis